MSRLATLLLLSSTQLTLGYNLIKTYSGDTFFDHFSYYSNYDNLTNGDIMWVNQSVAVGTPPLTYINDAGNAIIKVDDTTTVPYNEKRNSVRLTSNDKYNLGTVWVFDALHVPYGCSTWGALWSKAIGDLWPAGGEIDIFEGVNLQPANQMALHTQSGCNKAEGTQTGTTGASNCDNESSSGAGCTVIDADPASYGEAFANNNGGVWVTEFASSGIKIWFFTRENVPASLSSDSLDVSTLGTPSGDWPASSCDPSQFFSTQELVIDITLCGDWAGVESILEATCPALTGTNTCYTTYVLDPANYHNAYFELASIKIFADDPAAVSTGPTSTSTASGSSPSDGAAVKELSHNMILSPLIALATLVGTSFAWF